MEFKVKFIDLPNELFGIVNVKSNENVDDKPDNYEISMYNIENYLSKFNRIVDPVIISMFYGLYISKKLPTELNVEYSNCTKKEFGVDITKEVNIFTHLLFCLWLKENGFPNEFLNIRDYREKLYKFIKKLLDQDYFTNQIIPFYLNQARESDSGFIHEMKESGYLEFKSLQNSPEYLAMVFRAAQEDFEKTVIVPLFEKITPSLDSAKGYENFEYELKQLIAKGETGYTEFKSSALWSKNLNSEEIHDSTSTVVRNFGKDASKYIIARSIASFLNTDGGNLIIGIKENKETGNDEIIGIESEFGKIPDKNNDGYRRMLVDYIIRNYFEDDIYNNITKYIKITTPKIEGNTLCWLQIKKADKRVFVKTKIGDMFFIRTDAETREITGQELVDYCDQRYK